MRRMKSPLPRLKPAMRADLLALQTQLARRVQHPPPVGSRTLLIAGKVAGWISAPALHALADFPDARVSTQTLTLLPEHSSTPTHVTRTLTQVANVLRQTGCLKNWRDEQLDVMAEGQVLGQMERAAFRPLGLLTRAVRLNAWTPHGELWLARRAAHKATDPGKWDTLACGLIAAGETPQQALLREAHEEAGLLPGHLRHFPPARLICRLHKRVPEGYLTEDTLLSHGLLPDDAHPHNLDGEVDAFCTADLDALRELLKTDALTAEAAWAVVDGLLAG